MAAKAPSVSEYIAGVLAGNRTLLARAVTLIESVQPRHEAKAREVLRAILPHTGNAWRIGITGTPGAGKSTVIEALGMYLIEKGHRVAVLAIDPSSSLTHGSILGDKTRMEHLSRSEAAFIRPSPTAGALGGVARKTRETLLLCEAAGYDVILVETVGVGQSEIHVRDLVDCFVLLTLTGSGDDLQGIKKGVMEMLDILVLNKADGDNRKAAETALRHLSHTLHFLTPYTPGWGLKAQTLSAFSGSLIADFWQTVEQFFDHLNTAEQWQQQRAKQREVWLKQLLEEALLQRFYSDPDVIQAYPQVLQAVRAGELWSMDAMDTLLNSFFKGALPDS
jgi:LAO/AO transport system kinase